jgi:hypothetical protein
MVGRVGSRCVFSDRVEYYAVFDMQTASDRNEISSIWMWMWKRMWTQLRCDDKILSEGVLGMGA